MPAPVINCDALGAIEIVGTMAWFYLVQEQSCIDDPTIVEHVVTGKLFVPMSGIPEALWLMSLAISKEVTERASALVRKMGAH